MTDGMLFADKGSAEAKVFPRMCQNQGHPCWQSVTVKMAAGAMFPKTCVAKWLGLVARLLPPSCPSCLLWLTSLLEWPEFSIHARGTSLEKIYGLCQKTSLPISLETPKDSFSFFFPSYGGTEKSDRQQVLTRFVAASSLTRIPDLGT